MDTDELYGAAMEAWCSSTEIMMSPQPNMVFRKGAAGTYLGVTGVPAAALNAVFSSAQNPKTVDLKAFTDAPELAGLPWSILVRTEADGKVAHFAAEYGLTERSTSPIMVKSLDGSDLRSVETDTLRVRVLSGEDVAAYRRFLTAGFETPAEFFEMYIDPVVLDSPAMTAYFLEENGIPVATSLGIRTGDTVVVACVAVPPEYRRRGYGQAVTAATLRDARAAGATAAVLQSSPMGFSVYESLGFRKVGDLVQFAAPTES